MTIMDDNGQQSADDALEPQDDIYNPLKDQEILAEDNTPPAAPADDIYSHAPLDDPSTDDLLDSDEVYQEGVSGATNADDEQIGPDTELHPVRPSDN